MAEDGAKRGILDFFRSRSGSGPKKDDKKRSPDSEPRRKRYDSDDDEYASARRHRRRSLERKAKGRGDGDGPLPAEWPPSVEELPLGRAMDLISRGVPIHKGHKRLVPHGPDDYYPVASSTASRKEDKKPALADKDDGAAPVQKPAEEFYTLSTTTQKARPDDTDCANLRDIMVRPMTMRRVQNEEPAENPWDTLEQPSYSFYFGKLPGTVSLTQWAASGNNLPPASAPLPENPTGVTLRDVDMIKVFERLRELEKGAEDDSDDGLYRSLYRRFLKDPDKGNSPQRSLDRQIADLVIVLSRPDWIDFSNTKNQIVTRFIFDVAEIDPQNYLKFFHQLLFSLELDLRVCFKQPSAQDRLIAQFPPSVVWSLALARRWKDNVRVEAFGPKPDQVKLRYRRKRKQVKMLEDFARLMKWPNLADTVKALRQMEADGVLDSISSHAMAFFSGLVLPGPTWPFIVICTLIDVDPDSATDKIALLTPLQPQCGFQYRNAHTYWSATSIVGKVLAPTARSIAGWVGPCRPTDHLGRSQIAKVRSYRGRQAMPVMDITSMSERSDPLGPPANVYPAQEYNPIDPDLDKPATSVKFVQMNFKATGVTGEEPRWFEAAANFIVKGVPMDLRLKYDVTFISAFPCHDGPHPLFFDYTRHLIRVDDLTTIQNWGGLLPETETGIPPAEEVEDKEKVLAVEAYGARDNEVHARAWCSLWGHSAVVADIRRTCISCAIRETFASTLTVLILIDSKPEDPTRSDPARSDSRSRKDRDDPRFGKDDRRDRDRERDRGDRGDRDRDRDREKDRDRDDPRGTRASLHKS